MPALYSIIGRCTGRAWEALQALRDHSEFKSLVRALEQIDGTISEMDVHRAYSDLIERQYGDRRQHGERRRQPRYPR
jgi:hypothetical protein